MKRFVALICGKLHRNSEISAEELELAQASVARAK